MMMKEARERRIDERFPCPIEVFITLSRLRTRRPLYFDVRLLLPHPASNDASRESISTDNTKSFG